MENCPQCGYNPEINDLSDVSFIYGTGSVYRFGAGVHLTQGEIAIFELLYDAKEKGLTREELMHQLYSDRPECDWPASGSNVLDVHIHRMRNKLRKIGLLIGSTGRGWYKGRFILTQMRALNKEHAMKLDAAE